MRGGVSAAINDETKECHSQATTTTQNEQEDSFEPSSTNKKLYDKFYNMFRGEAGGQQINIKKTDDILICIVKSITDATGKPSGDALCVMYTNNKKKEEYLKLKNAGQNPDVTEYPYKEIYMIPLYVFAFEDILIFCLAQSTSDLFVFFVKKRDRGAVLVANDRLFFKKEIYPGPFVYTMNSIGYIESKKDVERYFNFEKDGWVGIDEIDALNRCGLERKIPVSEEDAKLIVDYIKKNYPKIAGRFKQLI